MTPTTIASWLLTYLLHSTVLVGGALLVVRTLGERRLALQEVLLRAALVGGVLTASLQTGLAIQPLTGTLPLAAEAGAVIRIDNTAPPQTVDLATTPAPAPTRPLTAAPPWVTLLLVLWGFGSLAAAVGLGRSIAQLRRLLATRRLRPPERLLQRIASAMGLHRPVRFSTSQAIAIPFATGIRRPEICCPERVDELAHEHRTALFAHELAHLARRDPGWQVAYRLGEAALCLQPLNRFARRRLEEIAEHLTDERAASCTGDRLGLARCLVVVAHWPAARDIGVPAVALAAGVRLDQRVRRLLAGSGTEDHCPRWASVLLVTLVVAAAGMLPAFAPAPAHAELSRDGSDAAPVQTWSNGEEPASDNVLPPLPPAAPALEINGELPRLPGLDEAPVIAPPAAPAPAALGVPSTPPSPAPEIAPAPDAAPEAAALPAPVIAPEPAPETPPATVTPPARIEKEPAAPAAAEEIARLREAERARAREQVEHIRKMVEEQRVRAEAVVRERREAGREEAERARDAAEEVARQARLTDARREELRIRVRESQTEAERAAREVAEEVARQARLTDARREELRIRVRESQTEAERAAREATAVDRELARARADEARALAREVAADREQLTEEQREAICRQAAELQAEAELRRRVTADRSRDQARRLAEEARRLAEQEEARRRIEEEKK